MSLGLRHFEEKSMIALSAIVFGLVGALAALDLRGTVYRDWPMGRTVLVGAAVGAVVGLALGLFLAIVLGVGNG